jgi:hypothetical protein
VRFFSTTTTTTTTLTPPLSQCLDLVEHESEQPRKKLRPQPSFTITDTLDFAIPNTDFIIYASQLPSHLEQYARQADSYCFAPQPPPAPQLPKPSTDTGSLPDDSMPIPHQVTRVMQCTANAVHAVHNLLWPAFGTQNRPTITADIAANYWSALVTTLKNESSIAVLEDGLAQFKRGAKNHAELMHLFAIHLAGHDRLLMAFDLFLPPHLSMTNLLVMQKTAVMAACAVDRNLENDDLALRHLARRVTEEAALGLTRKSDTALNDMLRNNEETLTSKQVVHSWVDTCCAKLGPNTKECLSFLSALLKLGKTRDKNEFARLCRNIEGILAPHADLMEVFNQIAALSG